MSFAKASLNLDAARKHFFMKRSFCLLSIYLHLGFSGWGEELVNLLLPVIREVFSQVWCATSAPLWCTGLFVVLLPEKRHCCRQDGFSCLLCLLLCFLLFTVCVSPCLSCWRAVLADSAGRGASPQSVSEALLVQVAVAFWIDWWQMLHCWREQRARRVRDER